MIYLFLTSTLLAFLFLTLWCIEHVRYTALSRSIVDLAYQLHIVPIKPCSPGVALLCLRDTIRDLENRVQALQEDIADYRAIMEQS